MPPVTPRPTPGLAPHGPPLVERATGLAAELRAAGCVFAEEEAALLVEAASDGAELDALVARRVAGLPLEQVLGWAQFCGLRIVVEPGVFVPRRRSEGLVRLAVERTGAADVVVDLCCGSGALGAAVRSARPDADVHAADLDPVAVRCARRNLGVQVYEGDLYDALPPALRGRVDVLLVNAPYVPSDAMASLPPETREHEPRHALDGGQDGLDVHRRVVDGAPAWLRAGGRVLIETSVAQAAVVAALMNSAGLAAHVAHDDEIGSTVVVGTRSTP
ncbi:putative protein N(5)-glutamine methyltransferase [Oerskovia flava]|uniref:putative protein N(5)-glutamine methyltransferase n=1 Tax=Oerskovia flava TaxID=2986422 RepID=UPI00223F9A27|nr:putative protein N(5)-glutamine methyltransferase [Oerskovia sp. JB1-3-2]